MTTRTSTDSARNDAYMEAVAMNLKLRKALEQCVLMVRDWHNMALQRLRDAASGPSAVDRSDAVNLVRNLREYGDNAKDKITMAGLLCLFDAVEGMDAALRGPSDEQSLELSQARTDLDAMAARLAQIEKDAARYRFLKARRGNVAEIAFNSFHSDIYSLAKMGNVDAAIDKAMEKDSSPATQRRPE